ncbi:MAG: hypothetical protein GVY18_11670 [Bacteroidetes bacterium]|nr:hypothetical protein [Bacteroidota bacterium]
MAQLGRRMLLLALLVLVAAPPLLAQPIRFGAADDPRERLQRVWWKREQTLELLGGFSLIGPQWRGAGQVSADIVTRPVTSHLGATFRAGYFGEYSPDLDEPYDILRAVSFLRYNPPPDVAMHLRLGTIERMRLGTGHVVNFFSSSVAWDERTVGAETMVRTAPLTVAAFTDNVTADGLVAARVGWRPVFWAANPRWSTATVGLNYVTDLADRPDEMDRLTAYNIDASFTAFRSGQIDFVPFASVAWYENHGSGISFGADLQSDNFIDLLSFRLRMALYYNGDAFIPNYVNTFYTVNSPTARTLDSDVTGAPNREDGLVGIPLAEAGGGNDLLTELRLLIIERFELWYSFRRHYGSQRLSEYHLHFFLRLYDRMRLNVTIDRYGLGGFFSTFSDLDDQSALNFGLDYQLLPPLWLSVDARYSFERVGDGPDGTERYLVQRRFEPFTGIHLRF